MKLNLLFGALVFLTIFSLSSPAQTRKEMRAKYKPSGEQTEGSGTSDIYHIRPDITAFFEYDKNEKAIQAIIQHITTKENNFKPLVMPYTLVQELLEELIPMSKRGKLCGNLERAFESNVRKTFVYENVLIKLEIPKPTSNESKETVRQAQFNSIKNTSCSINNLQFDF